MAAKTKKYKLVRKASCLLTGTARVRRGDEIDEKTYKQLSAQRKQWFDAVAAEPDDPEKDKKEENGKKANGGDK